MYKKLKKGDFVKVLKELLYTLALCVNIPLIAMEQAIENHSQFIERTRSLTPSQKQSSDLFQYFRYPIFGTLKTAGLYGNFEVQCPNNKFTAIFRSINDDFTEKEWNENPEFQPQLVLLNPAKFAYQIKLLENEMNKRFQAIALAADGNTFAIAYTKKSNAGKWNTKIKIQKADTKKTTDIIILPSTFKLADTYKYHAAIAFNKQTTAIIIWGIWLDKNLRKNGLAKANDYVISLIKTQ